MDARLSQGALVIGMFRGPLLRGTLIIHVHVLIVSFGPTHWCTPFSRHARFPPYIMSLLGRRRRWGDVGVRKRGSPWAAVSRGDIMLSSSNLHMIPIDARRHTQVFLRGLWFFKIRNAHSYGLAFRWIAGSFRRVLLGPKRCWQQFAGARPAALWQVTYERQESLRYIVFFNVNVEINKHTNPTLLAPCL